MYHHNPFGGWARAGNEQSSPWAGGSVPPPSVFGALPYPSTPPSPFVTFYFTSFNPTILNSTVVGPHGQIYFNIITDVEMPGYTVFKDAQGRNLALIEWQTRPLIEVRGILTKRNIKEWLKLSPEQSSRSMDVRGIRYTWAPRDQYINLSTGGPIGPKLLARISRGQGSVTLEMTSDAIQLGLLDVVVAAALLLQCGRNID